MADKRKMQPLRRCSFCGRTEKQVKKLISGPEGVYICDECVMICADIIEEGMIEDEPEEDEIHLRKPVEIKAFLDEARKRPRRHCPLLSTITISGFWPKVPPTMTWSSRRAIS